DRNRTHGAGGDRRRHDGGGAGLGPVRNVARHGRHRRARRARPPPPPSPGRLPGGGERARPHPRPRRPHQRDPPRARQRHALGDGAPARGPRVGVAGRTSGYGGRGPHPPARPGGQRRPRRPRRPPRARAPRGGGRPHARAAEEGRGAARRVPVPARALPEGHRGNAPPVLRGAILKRRSFAQGPLYLQLTGVVLGTLLLFAVLVVVIHVV